MLRPDDNVPAPGQDPPVDHVLLEAQYELNPAGICLVNDQRELVSCNRRFREIWRLTLENAPHKDMAVCLEAILRGLEDPAAFARLTGQPGAQQGELPLQDNRTLQFHSVPARHDQTFAGYVWYFYDITELTRMREQLRHLAYYDELTGLPNRRLFHDLLKHCLTGARRNEELVGVLFLDLDNFKQVNDILGHPAGDWFLCNTASLLRSCLREMDLICRWGGDEFVLALPAIKSLGDAEHVADKLIKAIADADVLDNPACPRPGLSIGISLFPCDAQGPDTLIRKADMAMYSAKQTGKNRYCFFPPSLPLSPPGSGEHQKNSDQHG
ncbi:MAG: hypothetical protein BWK76_15800 [Desulfobulbaceae bacterium A2]|nr:MAG: hypothetical protein BWK76_15800 [Desulfobulbaceae bacterium A2]